MRRAGLPFALGRVPGTPGADFRLRRVGDTPAAMIDTLLWDHDGVLVDTEHLYYQATREVLATLGIALTPESYRTLFLVGGGGA